MKQVVGPELSKGYNDSRIIVRRRPSAHGSDGWSLGGQMNRRLLEAIALALLVLVAGACGAGNNKPVSGAPTAAVGQPGAANAGPPIPAVPTKFTLSYIGPEPAALPIMIAQDAGIFQKHGLEVDLQTIAGAQSIAALVSGQIQASSGGSADILGAAVSGADPVVLAVLDASFPGQLYASPRIKTAADLKGKKVAVSNPGSSFDVVARESLPKMGLQPDKDVTLITTGSVANAVAALAAGAVDASPVQTGPDSVKLDGLGFHPIYDMTDVQSAGDAITVMRSYLTAHPDVVQRFIDALVEADARERSDKPFAIQEIQKRLGLNDAATQDAVYTFFIKPNILPPDPYPTAEQFRLPLAQLASKNDKAKGFDVTKIIDPSFVKSAADRHLDK
jgi:NitT/TauT family transport system substrate-binding protein